MLRNLAEQSRMGQKHGDLSERLIGAVAKPKGGAKDEKHSPSVKRRPLDSQVHSHFSELKPP